MTQKKNDTRIFWGLLAVFAATMVWAYVAGDFQTLMEHRTPEERAAAEQRALDHMFGNDQSFDASADNVTTAAQGKQDSVSWKTLSHAKMKEGKSIAVEFGDDVKKLDEQEISITGYMFPLEASGDQSHFLLSAYPPSCPYCLPGGPTELIEVTSSKPIKFTYDAIHLHGTFHLLSGEGLKDGMFYKMTKSN